MSPIILRSEPPWIVKTNLLTFSQDVSQWNTPTNLTTATDQTTAPDGTVTGDRYLETAVTGLHVQETTAFTFVAGVSYSYSVFVKSINSRNFEIGFPATVFTSRFAKFNLGTGAVGSADAGVTSGIEAWPDSWYRCWARSTCASGASARVGNFINDGALARNYAGNTANGVFIWGAQLEIGAVSPYNFTASTTARRTSRDYERQIWHSR